MNMYSETIYHNKSVEGFIFQFFEDYFFFIIYETIKKLI